MYASYVGAKISFVIKNTGSLPDLLLPSASDPASQPYIVSAALPFASVPAGQPYIALAAPAGACTTSAAD